MKVDIETAVDSLVRLVKEKKVISLDDAAKILGVPENIVNEWASFLEEDRILKIDYKLTKPYLKTAEDVGKIAQEKEDVASEKENMVRKLNYMLAGIQKRPLKSTAVLKTLEDVKKVLKDKNRTKDDVLNAQKFILQNGIKDLIAILQTINDIQKLREVAKQFDDLEKKKAIFERD